MNEFKKILESMVGTYDKKEIFRDFIACFAISLSNAVENDNDIEEQREKEYLHTINKYSKREREQIPVLTKIVIDELEKEVRDVLGDVFMELQLGNSKDQYFTPFSLAKLMAHMIDNNKTDDEEFVITDPACGSGALIIAKAVILGERGVNYQKQMKVYATDIDRTVLLMCYIQLSLLGINAVCEVRDTLEGTCYETWYTFMNRKVENLWVKKEI